MVTRFSLGELKFYETRIAVKGAIRIFLVNGSDICYTMLYPISLISLEDHSDIFRRISLCDKIFDMQLGDLESTLLSQLRFLFSLPVS